MDQYNWSAVPEEEMSPLLSRQAIHTEHMTIARLRIKKGALVPLHQHANEQVSMIEEGSLRFELAGKEVIVRAGEVLRIPPHVPHLAEALEDCVATDLFSPRRQDWINGDDAYLRKA
jgi:quercetin dioxygenase-like cupin family protein